MNTKEVKIPVSQNIKELIKASGFTQKYIASKLGIDYQKFSSMLNGRKIIHAEPWLVDLAKILSKSVDELLGRKDA